MTDVQTSRNGSPRVTTGVVTLLVAFVTQLVFTVIWAVHQEGRITITELALAEMMKRLDYLSTIDERSAERVRTLTERIDRQETPLSRRVDGIEARSSDVSSRLLMLEGRVNELYNKR